MGAGTAQYRHTHQFFRASSGTGNPGERANGVQIETLEMPLPDRLLRDGLQGAVGNGGGDWNDSRTSLRRAVGLRRV